MDPKQELLNKKGKDQKENDMQFLEKFIKQKEQQNKVLKKMLKSYKPSENKKSK